jgi:hypothetical protein
MKGFKKLSIWQSSINSVSMFLLENQQADLKVASSKGITTIVPILKDGKVVVETIYSV